MAPPSSIILIVDDQAAARATLEGMFAPEDNYELIFAADGLEALQKAAQFTPDLILLDVMMPGIDGYEVCRRLRADPRLAEVPVVMLTALDDRQSRLTAIEAGADDFITKPFQRAELRARVQMITRLNRQRKLMNERRRFDWVVEQSEDGFLELSDQDGILYTNHKARLLLGLAEENAGRVADKFIDLAQLSYRLEPEDAWSNWPGALVSDPDRQRFLVRPESERTNTLWLKLEILQPAGLVKAEKHLLRLHDVTGQMRLRNDLYSFHAAIQHKLYTPMSAILISLDLLNHRFDRSFSPDIRELIRYAREGAHDLQGILDEILEYTSLRSASQPGKATPAAQLAELAKQVAANLELNPENLTFAIADNALPAYLPLSPQILETILWELFDNSKKFHPQNRPQIEVSLERSDPGRLRLRVSDDGVSLPPEQLVRAWEPYYQAEKSFSGEVPGAGLGLPSVASIIWNAGGSCRLLNRIPGPGTVVEIYLPVSANSSQADTQVRPRPGNRPR